MAGIKCSLLLFIAAVCGSSSSVILPSTCMLSVQLMEAPTVGNPPAPICSTSCTGDLSMTWSDGVTYVKFSNVTERYQKMVAAEYHSGRLVDCKLVPYQTDEELAAQEEAIDDILDSCLPSTDDDASTTAGPTESTVESTTEAPTEAPTPEVVYPCSSGFSQLGDIKCYQAFSREVNWSEAQSYCRRMGAELVRIESREEQAFVVGLINFSVWTDLNDLRSEGTFTFTNGRRPSYSNWKRGEPNKKYRYQDCVELVKSDKYTWNDKICRFYSGYVCEKPTTMSTAV